MVFYTDRALNPFRNYLLALAPAEHLVPHSIPHGATDTEYRNILVASGLLDARLHVHAPIGDPPEALEDDLGGGEHNQAPAPVAHGARSDSDPDSSVPGTPPPVPPPSEPLEPEHPPAGPEAEALEAPLPFEPPCQNLTNMTYMVSATATGISGS